MIYVKTESGQSALLSRSLALTPRQRSAFIMFDGKRSMKEVLKATEGLGITQDDVAHMVTRGLLVPISTANKVAAMVSLPGAPVIAAAPAPLAPAPQPQADRQDAQAHYSKAYPIATRLTAGLGLRGFLLNLAVEAAGDLGKLRELAPKIEQAVGPEKFRELENALYE
ncbi:hypothetical protein [Polaromonas naphthalenivorans]|uniref:Uncharacterized protein n=1 Tax=Polaromonas naphthalenivorans (strain CJ2) TaxID=365044 RepID=A1VJH9_POLNA|nr:hypothetical protein [Polaromonas naphthalenivorans]ABM35807.1 conserved hypothetical protein [Polaromonas naphthalenivorans CJ2]